MRPALALLVFLCGACEREHAARITDGAIGPSVDLAVASDLSFVATGPLFLSQTGLYSDFASRTLTPGILEYVPRYPLWSDGSDKRRLLLLPPGTQIDTSDMDHWVFPVGTKVWKEFHAEGRLVETRLLQKVAEGPGGWWKMAYVWFGNGRAGAPTADAIAAPDGEPNAVGTTHDVPSQDFCNRCHDNVRDVLIGVSAFQLSAANGRGILSQLAAVGLLTAPPAHEFEVPGEGVVKDALGYLHGNCGHCHEDGSTIEHATVLRLRLRVQDLIPETTPTYLTSIGVRMYHLLNGNKIGVTPGALDKSQLYYRMSVRDLLQMPPVCTKVVDAVGLATVGDWILSLP